MNQISDASTRKNRVAWVSLLASALMAILKFTAAFATGSLGLLSEAFHSLIDLGATLVTLVAVNVGDRPADDTHHYGHAKVENLAALFEIVLLSGVAVWFAYRSISQLVLGFEPVTVTWWAIAILVLAIIVDHNRSRSLQKVADETSSGALAADAAHFHSDLLGSASVLVGLALIWAGFEWGDAVATLAVAVLIARIAWKLSRETLAVLLDAAPEGVTEAIRDQLESRSEVLSVTQLRVRPAGPVLFISAAINVPRTLPVNEIAHLKQDIERTIHAIYPSSDILVSANPVELDTETVFEKAQMLASQQGQSIHHLTVQKIGVRMAVSFDMEFDGAVPLSIAHDKATVLESSIRDALGGEVEVESHIEPLSLRALEGREVRTEDRTIIEGHLQTAVQNERLMSDVHNVRVRFTDGGHYVHYHCRFDGATSVDIVHQIIDRVENRLIESMPSIKRVIAHAEPLGMDKHQL